MENTVKQIVEKYNSNRNRLMDMLIDIQEGEGYISRDAIATLSQLLDMSQADVEQTLSFYHFFSTKPRGKYAVYLNNSPVAYMFGREAIKEAFEKSAGVRFGEVSSDGKIGLFDTACIGMNDQEPAAIINNMVFTRLTPYRVRELVKMMKEDKPIEELRKESFGDGKNYLPSLRSMVSSNIRRKGMILSDDYHFGTVLREKLPTLSPEGVIGEIKHSAIRGRGGAGFPTGLKWEFCRRAKGDKHYVVCNADEGEPGTFKDRVILTEKPELVFEGMALAGYAIGGEEGILYIRYEYRYMKDYLEEVLHKMRKEGLLGTNISGIEGFNFDIRIQFGAGAYVCGEESALLESLEGKRGEPRDKPPFPVEKGYLGYPTIINNVETFATAVRIVQNGGEWFTQFGTDDSTGTKILSISGDCMFPGVYEVNWGFNVEDMLDMVGAYDVQAVQVGGPSGTLIGPDEFHRTLGYSDLSTGGSMIIFGQQRNLLRDVVVNFMEFFIDESCGSCSTCRNMTQVMNNKLKKILAGKGVPNDLKDLQEWGRVLNASRCGLGQTAANPIISSLKNFRHLYEALLQKDKDFDEGFDLEKSVQASCSYVGRVPVFNHH
ncbi:MAG: NAD(P)H-dependent oxidoreductase subunit E [Bacteroidales bacterium]|jgi:[NiFe] hydrogenase diaphorase moiety large subunit|nr:NAD(P)H-dependent oxidoreductase subunit E [Bacteroidales bacterium]MDY0086084.1 NAD(P)H-dependent oxidoreductase subunit E [Bacteroidales bacterium]